MKMKEHAFKYQDPWKQFKLKVLKQIDYFDENELPKSFFDEV